MLKTRSLTITLILAAVLIWTCPAAADTVHLKNGDRLSGTVVSMDKSKLVFKTDYAGKLTIKWKQVASLVSDEEIKIETSEGKVFTGKAVQTKPDEIKLAGGPTVPVAQVTAINPEDTDTLQIHGQANLGFDTRRGNTNKENIDGFGRAIITWKTINRVIAGFELHKEQNKGADTVDNSLGYVDYNRFVSEKWYWLANLRGETDRFKNIDFRGMTGVGMGYQVWDTKITTLSFELGPDFVYLEDSRYGQSDWFAWRWNLRYTRWLFDHFTEFYHHQTGFLQMDNMDNVIWSTRQGLNFPLAWGIIFTTSFNLDYDSQPDEGKSPTDTRFILSLGYKW